jgi:archaeal chaperonin
VKVDLNSVKILKKHGKSLNDTSLIDGFVIDRKLVWQGMPKHVENAKIALVCGALEVKEVKGRDFADAKLGITSISQATAFEDKQEKILKAMVDKIKASGANVALINRGLDEIASYYLAQAGIPTWKRIFIPDMDLIAKITGGKLVGINELTPETLGHADDVKEMVVGKKKFLSIQGGKGREASTIFVRGGTLHEVEEAERALHDSLCAVRNSIEDKRIVTGGGSTEMAISASLKSLAMNTESREQLAIEAFADAIQIVPKVLAENAGLNPLDVLSTLKNEQATGGSCLGIDSLGMKVADMKTLGIFEPLRTKAQVIKSATEVAIALLRIDNVCFVKGSVKKAPEPTDEPPKYEHAMDWLDEEENA